MALAEKEFIECLGDGKPIEGSISAPPSKAYTLRALFISSLAEGKSVLRNALFAEDQSHAANALNELGVNVKRAGNDFVVEGGLSRMRQPKKELFLGNSGVSVRFLVSLAALVPNAKTVITGDERMQSGRPSKELLDALAGLGVEAKSIRGNGCPPIEVKGGTFRGGRTGLSGETSSQYFSSILIAAPYAKEDVAVAAEGIMRSKPYIDITADCMDSFGVKMENKKYRSFSVKHGQRYKPRTYDIEGDYSNAAYFFAAAAVTKGKVKVSNLNPKSAQGDKIFVECLRRMGCKTESGKDYVVVQGAERLKPITIGLGDYPDIVPPLAVVAAFAKGKSEFTNIGHLRFKESDRISTVVTELKRCGISAEETKDSMVVQGIGHEGIRALKPAEIQTYKDHRIAMSFSVMGLTAKGMKIINPGAVSKSFPDFYERMNELAGGKVFV